jgi:dolichol-phosphate mannosyltransferase
MAQKSPSSRPSRVSIFHTESKIATPNRQRPTVLRGTGRQRLSVVIPTRNEAGNVAVLQQRLAEALSGIDHEIIIVDDSNDDVSRPALATAAASDPTWRVIERSKREQTGLGSAVVEGLRMARGDAVCVMDGDLQHPPELIPRLLEQVEQGADMAVASRYMPGGSRAGLGGFSRVVVSRAATVVAKLFFHEARMTSDPLTGFFCCRRSAMAGLEFRPLGFKVLLEVLVCGHNLKVVDVPLTFLSRHAGESKATTRQGMLYLHHIWSLFVYIPGSARTAKLAIVTAASLAVFFPLIWVLHHAEGVPWLLAWLIASGVSAAVAVALQRTFTFRDLNSRGEPDGARLQYPLVAMGFFVGFGTFAVATTGRDHPWLVLAAVSQCLAMLVTLVLNRPGIRARINLSLSQGPPANLEALGKRLSADRTWWADLTKSPHAPERRRLVRLLGDDVIQSVARRGRPMLWIESPSTRPQPRVNVETTSALLIPFLNGQGDVVAVAVLGRHSSNLFQTRDLAKAINWLHKLGSDWHGLASKATVAEATVVEETPAEENVAEEKAASTSPLQLAGGS